jgi:peptidoglycan/LPS O-acetylase OafA/YrhL
LLFIPIFAGSVPLFPLDGVQWSLALELIGNLLHAKFFKSLPWQVLAILAAISLALLGWASFRNGSMGVGDTASNGLGGLPRLLFSYLLGCLLYRAIDGARIGTLRFRPFLLFLLPAALILAGYAGRMWTGWLVDLFTVAAVMPAMVLIGAHVQLDGLWARVAREGGLASYPLYALHLPIVCAMAIVGGPPLIRHPVGMALAVLGAWAAGRYFSNPPQTNSSEPEAMSVCLLSTHSCH